MSSGFVLFLYYKHIIYSKLRGKRSTIKFFEACTSNNKYGSVHDYQLNDSLVSSIWFRMDSVSHISCRISAAFLVRAVWLLLLPHAHHHVWLSMDSEAVDGGALRSWVLWIKSMLAAHCSANRETYPFNLTNPKSFHYHLISGASAAIIRIQIPVFYYEFNIITSTKST